VLLDKIWREKKVCNKFCLRFARLIDFVWLYIQTDQSVSGALIKREFDESVVNFLDHKKKSDM